MRLSFKLALAVLCVASAFSGFAFAEPAEGSRENAVKREATGPGGDERLVLRGEVSTGFGADDLATDFGASGLWLYSGDVWSVLSPSDPEDLIACCDGLVGEFGAGEGLWLYDDLGWTQLSVTDPVELVCWSHRLAARFEPAFGFWLYDCTTSTWEHLTYSEPERIATTPAALFADFGGLGLWRYDSRGWQLVTPGDAEDMEGGLADAASGPFVTGQTSCWDGVGVPIACEGTGQDGEYQAGVPSPAPRFTENLDGTVTDALTGLVYLQDANCFGFRDWAGALAAANTLSDGSCGLTDGSAVGDWRLPNLRESLSLFDYDRYTPALAAGHPLVSVQPFFYWTSTTRADTSHYAWGVGFSTGGTSAYNKTGNGCLLPVRGGR